MTSELKSAASRANGAKSRGPKSPETRQRASSNSLNHGFTSKKTVVLACESAEDFQKMIADYAETYHPGSRVEEDLVAEMVAANWRMQRLRMIETALYDSEMDDEIDTDADNETAADPGRQLSRAFRRLVDGSRAISLASRYESRLYRMHERTRGALRELQQARKQEAAQPAAPAPVQPDPPTPPTEKNRETNLTAPAAGTLPRQGLSIVRQRGIHRIDFKRFLRYEPRKIA